MVYAIVVDALTCEADIVNSRQTKLQISQCPPPPTTAAETNSTWYVAVVDAGKDNFYVPGFRNQLP